MLKWRKNTMTYDSCACSMCPCKNKPDSEFSGLCVCCQIDIHAEWTKKYMKERGIKWL